MFQPMLSTFNHMTKTDKISSKRKAINNVRNKTFRLFTEIFRFSGGQSSLIAFEGNNFIYDN